jgi:hypothetical protein
MVMDNAHQAMARAKTISVYVKSPKALDVRRGIYFLSQFRLEGAANLICARLQDVAKGRGKIDKILVLARAMFGLEEALRRSIEDSVRQEMRNMSAQGIREEDGPGNPSFVPNQPVGVAPEAAASPTSNQSRSAHRAPDLPALHPRPPRSLYILKNSHFTTGII